MIKKISLLFLLSVFTLVVSTPDLLNLFQEDKNVNMLIDSTDQEKKESETSKEKEIKILELNDFCNFTNDCIGEELSTYGEREYTTVYLNLVSPPPEFS